MLAAVRTCDLKALSPVPAGQISEELTLFDRASRSLTFVIRSGVPGFMRFVENAWTVEALGDNLDTAAAGHSGSAPWPTLVLVRGGEDGHE